MPLRRRNLGQRRRRRRRAQLRSRGAGSCATRCGSSGRWVPTSSCGSCLAAAPSRGAAWPSGSLPPRPRG
uniref:Uncharacterized protein n=1 Tax=Arundo donax TaxID=35708 RepID=A0A0A9BFF4_ARUDO